MESLHTLLLVLALSGGRMHDGLAHQVLQMHRERFHKMKTFVLFAQAVVVHGYFLARGIPQVSSSTGTTVLITSDVVMAQLQAGQQDALTQWFVRDVVAQGVKLILDLMQPSALEESLAQQLLSRMQLVRAAPQEQAGRTTGPLHKSHRGGHQPGKNEEGDDDEDEEEDEEEDDEEDDDEEDDDEEDDDEDEDRAQGIGDPQPYFTYAIKEGDTLSGLAKRYFGDAQKSHLFGGLENVASPEQVPVGTRIRVPCRWVAVMEGDNLALIAQRTLGDGTKWRRIWAANRKQVPDKDTLTVGQILAVPSEASWSADAHTTGQEPAPAERSPRDLGAAPLASFLYIVQEGETLSVLAKRFFGDSHNYPVLVRGMDPLPDDPDKVPAGAEIHVPCVQVTVGEGDNLRRIAERTLHDGNAWPRIWAANRKAVKDPNQLRAGQVLAVPIVPPDTGDDRAQAFHGGFHGGGFRGGWGWGAPLLAADMGLSLGLLGAESALVTDEALLLAAATAPLWRAQGQGDGPLQTPAVQRYLAGLPALPTAPTDARAQAFGGRGGGYGGRGYGHGYGGYGGYGGRGWGYGGWGGYGWGFRPWTAAALWALPAAEVSVLAANEIARLQTLGLVAAASQAQMLAQQGQYAAAVLAAQQAQQQVQQQQAPMAPAPDYPTDYPTDEVRAQAYGVNMIAMMGLPSFVAVGGLAPFWGSPPLTPDGLRLRLVQDFKQYLTATGASSDQQTLEQFIAAEVRRTVEWMSAAHLTLVEVLRQLRSRPLSSLGKDGSGQEIQHYQGGRLLMLFVAALTVYLTAGAQQQLPVFHADMMIVDPSDHDLGAVLDKCFEIAVDEAKSLDHVMSDLFSLMLIAP